MFDGFSGNGRLQTAGTGLSVPHSSYGEHKARCPLYDVWRPWARQVTGQPMPTTHFVAEDQPEQTADVLTEFLDQHVTTPEPR
jgi:hypothetical protein